MKQFSLKETEDKTCLLPGVIAMCVADEHIDNVAEADFFIDYAVKRFVKLYNNNAHFRKRLTYGRNLDRAYMFFGHWMEAWKVDPSHVMQWVNDSPDFINPSNSVYNHKTKTFNPAITSQGFDYVAH